MPPAPQHRILFVVPPLAAHVSPAAAVADELESRGHRVAWAGQPLALESQLGGGARVFPCAGPPGTGHGIAGLRGAAVRQRLWEEFYAPLAVAMVPGVTAAVLEFTPDLLVVDQQAVAGVLVAERLRAPFVTSCTTPAGLTGGGGTAASGHASRMAGREADRDADRIVRLLAGLRQRLGAPSARYDPRFSPLLTLVFSTPELTGARPLPATPVRFLGPALGSRPAVPDFPWEWLERDAEPPLALIDPGGAGPEQGTPFVEACVAAVRARTGRMRALVVDPAEVSTADRSADRTADPDVLVCPAVPRPALLERVRAVICRGDHDTVAEALWHGVPLVLAPLCGEQPLVAARVAAAGAGVRVRSRRSRPERLGAALDAVLGEPRYAEAARRVGAAFRAAGGAGAAAAQLEELAAEEGDFPWHGW